MSQPDIPINDQALLKTILNQKNEWTNSIPILKKPLSKGLTNNSYLLEADNTLFVLRINSEATETIAINRAKERSILRQTCDAKIAPKLIYFEPSEKYIISKFIEGKQWVPKKNQDQKDIISLAKLIYKIHSLEAVNTSMTIAERIEYYWQQLNTQTTTVNQLQSIKPELQIHLQAMQSFCTYYRLCHNDLLPENIIVNTQDKLIALDWEYAAMGDPYFDLAVVAEGHKLNRKKREQLLNGYNNCKPTKDQIERLYHSRVVYCYIELLWYCVRFSDQEQLAMKKTLYKKFEDIKKLLANKEIG